MKWAGTLITILVCQFLVIPVAHAAGTGAVVCSIKISGSTGDPSEYVDICNNTDSEIDISNWTLDYIKPHLDTVLPEAFCEQESSWKSTVGSINSKEVIVPADTVLQPSAHYRVKIAKMNDDIGGAVRLQAHYVDGLTETADLVGWGNDGSEPICSEKNRTVVPGKDQVLKRISNIDGILVDNNDNYCDFIIAGSEGSACRPDETDEETGNPGSDFPKVYISELLANPVSPLSDNEYEYIELYNPNSELVSLKGYQLFSGDAYTYKYTVPDIAIGPKNYLALYSSETKLALSNSSSRTRLLDPAGNKIDESEGYNNAAEGKAWALIDEIWQFTDKPTPNLANEASIIEQEQQPVSAVNTESDTLSPCPAGKYRNPETNRCKSIESGSELSTCGPGQVRNPDTNRCRSTASVLSASLIPCQAGYIRNPQTNRCRKAVQEDDNLLKPCQPGYERNPSTNRCRKIIATPAANFAAIKSDAENASDAVPMSFQWWVTGVVASGIVGYGMFEWRHEILSLIQKLRGRFGGSEPLQ